MTTFAVPPKVQARLARKAAPKPTLTELTHSEIIPIVDWPAYRAAHPELVFSGRFDAEGRPIFTDGIH